MARGGVGRGHAPDGQGGREPRVRGHLLVGEDRAEGRRVRFRLARPRHRQARQGRHRGRSGVRDRVPADVAHPGASGGAVEGLPGRCVPAGRPPALEADQPGVPRVRVEAVPRDGRALQGQSVRGRLACGQRVRLPQPLRLFRRRRARLPEVVREEVRHHRRRQRRLGHRILGAAHEQFFRDHPAALHRRRQLHEPGQAA